LLYSIPVLLVSSFLSFMFVSLAGDPRANLRQNPRVSRLKLHHLEHQYHLDTSHSRSLLVTGSRTC
jgi:ABC-type dipeptide/oligopeptide/nickel transport system permease component